MGFIAGAVSRWTPGRIYQALPGTNVDLEGDIAYWLLLRQADRAHPHALQASTESIWRVMHEAG